MAVQNRIFLPKNKNTQRRRGRRVSNGMSVRNHKRKIFLCRWNQPESVVHDTNINITKSDLFASSVMKNERRRRYRGQEPGFTIEHFLFNIYIWSLVAYPGKCSNIIKDKIDTSDEKVFTIFIITSSTLENLAILIFWWMIQ